MRYEQSTTESLDETKTCECTHRNPSSSCYANEYRRIEHLAKDLIFLGQHPDDAIFDLVETCLEEDIEVTVPEIARIIDHALYWYSKGQPQGCTSEPGSAAPMPEDGR